MSMDAELFPEPGGDRAGRGASAGLAGPGCPAGASRRLPCVGPPTGRTANGAHARRRHDDLPAGVPGLALVPVPVRAHGGRRRRRPGGQLPAWLDELGRRAVADTLGPEAATAPYDIALINFYDADARMGMHRDSDEKSDAPVVSLSLATRASSASGTPSRARARTRMSSCAAGTCSCSAGASRLAYHGVPECSPTRRRPDLGLTGRLNVTLRVSGFQVPSDGAPHERIMGDSPS